MTRPFEGEAVRIGPASLGRFRCAAQEDLAVPTSLLTALSGDKRKRLGLEVWKHSAHNGALANQPNLLNCAVPF